MLSKLVRVLLLINSLAVFNVYAQVGGSSDFEWVNSVASSKPMALGGTNILKYSELQSNFLSNPSTLQDSASHIVNLDFISNKLWNKYQVSYENFFPKIGSIGIVMQSYGFGDFESTDQFGNTQGSFQVNNFLLGLSYKHTIAHFSTGISVKLVQNRIDSYSSSALLFDLGGLFVHPKADFQVGLTLKNIGTAFKNYYEGYNANMPIDVQFGASFKPQNMPLKFYLTIHQINTPDLSYQSLAQSCFRRSPG